MYNQKLAVAIKSSNKVLREFEDKVFLPFNSNYSIFIKNMNSVRASVKIQIDGIEVTEGVSLIVEPNSSIELERFIKNGNLSKGNKFKFIDRVKEIEEYRGVNIEDGLIFIEFQFEKNIGIMNTNYWYDCIGKQIDVNPYNPTKWKYGDIICQSNNIGSAGLNQNYMQGVVQTSFENPKAINKSGITVPGEISNQKFDEVSSFNLEDKKHVIVLQLCGEVAGKEILKTITTRSKIKCISCGSISKSSIAKFCSTCGTCLEII